MKNYSISYLDAAGRTRNSEFLPFEDNRTAVDFARIGLVGSAVVEVWKDGDLVGRLYRDPSPAPVATGNVADNALRALSRADSRNNLDGWDNEGGAARAVPSAGSMRPADRRAAETSPGEPVSR